MSDETTLPDSSFWRGRRVLVTGHTGFKGAWTALLLRSVGAEVYGLSLPPRNENDLFNVARLRDDLVHRLGDIRDIATMRGALEALLLVNEHLEAELHQLYAAVSFVGRDECCETMH